MAQTSPNRPAFPYHLTLLVENGLGREKEVAKSIRINIFSKKDKGILAKLETKGIDAGQLIDCI